MYKVTYRNLRTNETRFYFVNSYLINVLDIQYVADILKVVKGDVIERTCEDSVFYFKVVDQHLEKASNFDVIKALSKYGNV